MIVAPPPPAGLTVSPARVELAPAAAAVVQVRNPTTRAVVVDTEAAVYALAPNGRPAIVAARGGVRLVVRPRTFALPAGATATVRVSARAAGRATPGDHAELVVLATRATRAGGVGVRLRVGVPVLVRVPGAVVRKLVIRRARFAGRLLIVELRNLGNVVERLVGARVDIVRRGRVVARLQAGPREVLPGSRAVLRLRCPPLRPGPVAVVLRRAGGRP